MSPPSTTTASTIAIDLEQDEMGFEAWVNGQCAYLCAICNQMFFDSSEFWQHVNRDHLVSLDKYKELHGHPFHRRRFHDCRMPNCKMRIDWDKEKLMNHFFRHHRSITPRNYYEAYVRRHQVTIKQEVIDSDGELVPDSVIESPIAHNPLLVPPRFIAHHGARKTASLSSLSSNNSLKPMQRYSQVTKTPIKIKIKPRKIPLGKRPLQSGSSRPGPASKRRAAAPYPEEDQSSQQPVPLPA